MANTYTQIYIHSIFAVQNRTALILPTFKDHLYKYITGIVRNKGQRLFAINGMPDHIHLLLSIKPDYNLSDLVREVKKSSTNFIKEQGFCKAAFRWQEGFSAFSCGASQLDQVVDYIQNQEFHHQKRTFQEEYFGLLKRYNIEFKEEYGFEFFEK